MASEGHIDVPGGSVWYRSVGEGPGVPLLVVHGGPGFCHDYLTALDDLADRRQVVYWDQLGCGRSERPDDDSLWTVDRYVQEVDAVRGALGLDRHHMFGNSWGGMLGMQYAIDRRPPLVSLTISNSPASMPRFIEETTALKANLPEDVQRTIDWHEERGFYACPEYQGAIAVWFQTHICRMQPWPEGLERSLSGVGVAPYMAMVGPSDFNVTGNLLWWNVMAAALPRSTSRRCSSPVATTRSSPTTCAPSTSRSPDPSSSSSKTPRTCRSRRSASAAWRR